MIFFAVCSVSVPLLARFSARSMAKQASHASALLSAAFFGEPLFRASPLSGLILILVDFFSR
jgi:hypothetical protein